MRTALLLLLLASPLFAADIEAPATAPEHSLVELRTPAEGKGFAWFVTGPQGFVKTAVDSGDRSRAIFTGPPGKYAVMLVVSLPDGTLDQGQAIVTIGTPGPLPPTPPDPVVPPTPPGPVDPPVVSGKRSLLLIHESADDTPEVSRMLVGLRQGPSAAYLASKSHKLHILDDDSVDATGKPAALLEPWKPHFAGMKLPALFVLDETGKTLIHKQELPAGTTAAQVVEIVKGKGG